ncbi:hypothetical protein [Parapedomonas caeni]|jgi:hypothetical protein
MTWNTIRLELARTREYPEGSPSHAYMLHLPLDDRGYIDEDAWRQSPARATVTRFWPGEPDLRGQVIRTRGRAWAFSYEPGTDDDEPIYHLENHVLRVGEYVSITETDGDRLPFRVVSCHS